MKRKRAAYLLLIPVAADGPVTLHRQIYAWFREAILGGRLHPGQIVPSSRELAAEMRGNVSSRRGCRAAPAFRRGLGRAVAAPYRRVPRWGAGYRRLSDGHLVVAARGQCAALAR
ncbi:MAG: hypothetical protein ACREPL_02715 [Rhodanobacteraceae bacterium]